MGDVFKAIADPTRRAILDELTERNGQTLFEICSRMVMKHKLSSSRQAISQHMDVLESAGLVKTKKEGRYKFHYIDTAPLKDVAERWPIED
ncbi:MAG TPA: helix-turn-helix domain-containing protein [Actinomycetota bacterium]|nr:helix-turn-helix domain-containing protein [Actinomycetota bacterium]